MSSSIRFPLNLLCVTVFFFSNTIHATGVPLGEIGCLACLTCAIVRATCGPELHNCGASLASPPAMNSGQRRNFATINRGEQSLGLPVSQRFRPLQHGESPEEFEERLRRRLLELGAEADRINQARNAIHDHRFGVGSEIPVNRASEPNAASDSVAFSGFMGTASTPP